MRADDSALISFAEDLRQEVLTEAELPDQEFMRAEVFARRMIDVLVEAGEVEEALPAYHRGHGVEVSAYGIEDEDTLNLLVADYRGEVPPSSLTRTQIDVAHRRLETLWTRCSTAAYHEQLEESSDAYDMARHIHQGARRIRRLRLIVVTDGMSAVEFLPPEERNGVEVHRAVWDIGRLFRMEASGRGREPVDVDFAAHHGGPLQCLGTGDSGEDYSAFLAVVPGRVLADIYEQHGARLLELNVRSFLQAAGKVNRGIRDTLLHAPERFLAYNNGISATAAEVDLVSLSGGGTGIARIRDFQIVNGGQTTASVHRARRQADLERVAVQAKITVVAPERLEEIVPLISRFANSQNKVQEADLSANHPFHVQLETLSRSVWAPATGDTLRQTRWFYERARGSYADALNRAPTSARRRAFRAVHPTAQKFAKTDIAKFENTWDQLPHEVSRGAQKNFTVFMARVKERNLIPDRAYFERLVAKALLFRRTERIVTAQRFGGYRANIVTYAVAKLAHATAQRIDLSKIWQAQALSPALEAAVTELSHLAFEVIAERTPNGANVTEWSKREQCWVLLRELPWEPSSQLRTELVGRGKRGVANSDPRDVNPEHVAAATSPGVDGWLSIANWAKETDNLTPWQRRFAYTIGVQLQRGRELSAKQATQAVRILEDAKRVGFDPTMTPIRPTTGGHDDPSEDPHAGSPADEIKPLVGEPAEDEALPEKPVPTSQNAVASGDVLVEHVLSPRASNVLRRIGLRTLGEVSARSDGELAAAPDLGSKVLAEIELALAAHGLQLDDTSASTKPDPPSAPGSSLDGGPAPTSARPGGRPRDASRDEEVGRLRAEGLTLQAIADTIGVTRERVRQILTASGQGVTQEYLSQLRREERLEDARQHMEQLLAAFRAGRSIRDVAGGLGIAGDAAVEVVDAALTPADRAERGRNSGRASSGPTYAEEDLIGAVRRVADEVGRVPSSNDYGRLAGRLGLPSLPTIMNRLGGWSAAVRQAGMVPNQSRRSYERTWGERACWMALEALVDELGQLPTVEHYDALAASREDLPSLATVRNRLGRWSEVAATLARGERPSESIDEEAREEDDKGPASRPKPTDRPTGRLAVSDGGSRSDLGPARRLVRQLRELPEDLRSELFVAAQDAVVDQALQAVLMASITGQPGRDSELRIEATEQQLDHGLMRVSERLDQPKVRRIAYALQVRGAERPARALLREA